MNKGCCFKKILFFFFLFLSVTAFAQNSSKKPIITEQYLEYLKQGYMEMCKEVNKQLPVDVDELTTLTNILFSNWTLTCKYRINLDLKDLTLDECKEFMEEIRKPTLEHAKRVIMFRDGAVQSQIKEEIRVTGFVLKQSYFDENELYIGTNTYGYKDFFGSK